ncbi:MAG TPA: nitroreductase/quinone reductase family protein [Gaiella sp.]|jgi:deazaflavin-dependent oxidoreductase (nitroreductase family)
MRRRLQAIDDRLERRLYPHGRPNRLARLLNGAWAVVHAAGVWPGRLVTLEVRGRRTGRAVSFPLVMADYGGDRYLVSMLGESNWVRNVRAAGGRAVLRHGRSEAVRLEEVPPDARAPILRRYLSLAPGPRAFIPVDPRSPVEAFAAVAPHVPVFRIATDDRRR